MSCAGLTSTLRRFRRVDRQGSSVSPVQVPELDADTDPLFVLAQRDPRRRRRLVGFEVQLHDNTFDELRAIGQETLDTLQGLDERPYEPTAELERGEECFSIPVGDLPEPQHGEADDEDEAYEGVADLLAIVADPTGLISIHAADLGQQKYLAYGIVFTDTDQNRIGFFRQDDPARPVRRGRFFGRFTDTLRRIEDPPSLILYSDIDVVVTPARIFVFRKVAFERLLADVNVALAEVDGSVEDIASVLGDQMPLATGVTETLQEVGAHRPSFALRLRRLGSRARQLTADGVTGKDVRASIVEVDGDPDELLNDNDEFDFGEDQVRAFLDVLEGRWFKDSLGGEPRRADRYSRRS